MDRLLISLRLTVGRPLDCPPMAPDSNHGHTARRAMSRQPGASMLAQPSPDARRSSAITPRGRAIPPHRNRDRSRPPWNPSRLTGRVMPHAQQHRPVASWDTEHLRDLLVRASREVRKLSTVTESMRWARRSRCLGCQSTAVDAMAAQFGPWLSEFVHAGARTRCRASCRTRTH